MPTNAVPGSSSDPNTGQIKPPTHGYGLAPGIESNLVSTGSERVTSESPPMFWSRGEQYPFDPASWRPASTLFPFEENEEGDTAETQGAAPSSPPPNPSITPNSPPNPPEPSRHPSRPSVSKDKYVAAERIWLDDKLSKNEGLTSREVADAFNEEFEGKIIEGDSGPRPRREGRAILAYRSIKKAKDAAAAGGSSGA
ncbi:MAG: hypothetical protein M1820_003594 [Bogoriella megaspora]|nr:MAG: hypothetical protein M1820_003594 [Bogoriella megaspora]